MNMRIQPNYASYNNLYRRNPVVVAPKMSPVNFTGYTYASNASKFSLNTLNPINMYINKIFERSLMASRRRIQTVISEIAPYQKEIPLGESYAWDINKGNRKKYLLVLHGTSQNISNLQSLYGEVIKNTKFAIFAPEYRSFGKNKPSIVSAKTFDEDTQNAINYLEKEKRVKPKDIYVLGHSFGGFAATQLVSKNPDLGKLILVSSIDSLKHESVDIDKSLRNKTSKFITFLFKHFSFLRRSLSEVFKTNNLLKNIDTPVEIIHSKNDRLIKVQSSQNLASMCKNLEGLHILDSGGHGLGSSKIETIVEILRRN